MKKYFLLPLMALFALNAVAQDFDTEPVVKFDNESENLKFTIGARMMADVAYYHSDFTPLKSGAALTDARIRTSMTYQNWYFFADFDFSKGKFKQKNIFLQYAWDQNKDQSNWKWHAIKAGYYNDPASMSRNTSIGSYHFISRPGMVNALQNGRQLGVSYKYVDKNVFLHQGIYAENLYNDQIAGFQGATISGRWLYLPINTETNTLHIGVGARYAKLKTGTVNSNVVQTNLNLSTSLETYVDPDAQFVNANVPWASDVFNVNVEALYRGKKFFVRGEYTYKAIGKDRDDETLFKNQLGTLWSWGSLESWQAGNPLKTSHFQGAYVEAGFLVFGQPYTYNRKEALLGGLGGKSLEIVARYSWTDLNDVVDGAYYFVAQDKYIDNGILADYPVASTSIGGGELHSVTLGVNYAINRFVQVMVNYSYHNLNRDKYAYDKNFHGVQGRLVFSF
ncbi:MAG: hypothetical protein J6J64_07850 [Alistipes sp.]|nr:hypothetical protein [Alistipes sp.]